MQKIQEPQQRISRNAVKVWRISSMIGHLITLSILGGLVFLHNRYDWVEWVGYILFILVILVLLHAVYGIFIYPVYQQRTWRYAINEHYVQLKHGVLEKSHIIVPMTKVQYVNTNQGPILRRYKLATVTIGTMASSHEIPAIPEREAMELRNHIAFLAKITEKELPNDTE